MKNLKKVLAMVLAFACTFTMFAGAKVFEDVPAGSDYSEAITMLSDLGIIKGKTETTYAPDETITREEACTLIARLLTGEQDVVGFENAQNFTDTKYSWAKSAIGYCVVNGIVVGDGNGKFRPMDKITDAEFVTMVVRAMGYETADMKQNYPHSYLSAAMAKGLLDNVNMVATSDALRGENAQIIYNALFADYARGAMNNNQISGTTNQVYPTLAESVWNLSKARVGNWDGKTDEKPYLDESNCEAHTWVIVGEAPDKDNALLAYPIDDDDSVKLYDSGEKSDKRYAPYKFKYEGDASTIEALKGYKVELYGEGSHGKPTWNSKDKTFVYSENWTIKAIKTTKGQTATDYNASMADKKDKDGSVTVGESTISLGNAASNAKNVTSDAEVPTVATFMGKSLNEISVKDDKTAEEAMNIRNGNQYKLMDWDSDGEADWIVVDQANYYRVESATSKRVTVTSMKADKKMDSNASSQTETWKLDDNESVGKTQGNVNTNIKYVVPEGVKEGDILEVTYKVTGEKNDMLITATATVVESENQKLEKVGSRDGLTLTFGDEELKVAQNANLGNVIVPNNPQDYKGFNGEELGTEFALWQDRNGFIVHSDYATESTNYMMVLNTFGSKDSIGNRDLAVIDMLTANNEEKQDVKVASNARVLDKDGNTLSVNGVNAYEGRKFDESQVVGNVFKYWTDEDGVITKMQAVFTSNDAANDAAKAGYKYDADADRLTDKNGRYIASLEDANVIFAVKGDYIAADNAGGTLTGNDIKVNVSDVLATKQSGIPDIGSNPASATLLGKSLLSRQSWLGTSFREDDPKYNANQFVINTDKNSGANAAILGVDSFNKFGAGDTKLGLVTNVSERNGGYVEIDVAIDGEVKTISTKEKTKFDEIVKIFDGTNDIDVAGVDSTISVPNNGIFNGKKLSNTVNYGGMYAEVTTDKDGNLTKVTFMDDDTTNNNDNLLRGHYYTVSRNLILNVSDKNLRYGLNDNQSYGNVKAAQYYASDSELYTVGRLEAASAGYADDAKFYNIDATPSRHEGKNYDGARLTVNAGFDNLRDSDITAGEKGDIDYSEPNYDSTKNVYEIADLAFDSNGDIIAAFSFKSLDEKYVKSMVLLSGVTQPSYDANGKITVTASTSDGSPAPGNRGVAVYNEKGENVSHLFTIGGAGNMEITVLTSTPSGTYTIKLLDLDNKPMAGGTTFVVSNTTTVTPLNVTQVGFTGKDGKAEISADGKSFKIALNGASAYAASVTAPLTKDNLAAYQNKNTRLTITDVKKDAEKEIYTVTVAETLQAGDKLEVLVVAGGNVTVNGQTSGTATSGEKETVVEGSTAEGVTVVSGYDGKEVPGGKAQSGGTDIYVQIGGADGTLNDKITVETDKSVPVEGVTAKGNSAGIYQLKNSSNWVAGSYKLLVDGKAVGTFEVVDPITLSAAEATINVLDTTVEDVTITLGGAPEGTTIAVSDATIDNSTKGQTEKEIDGVTAKVEDGKLKISGTPTTNDTAREFHVGYWDGSKAVETTFTVSVEKVKANALTADISLEEDNKTIILTLQKGGEDVTQAQMTALGLDNTTGKYTVTNDDSKTLSTVTLANGKITLALNAALGSGKKVSKVKINATTFLEEVTVTKDLTSTA